MPSEVLERPAQPPESKPMSADQTFKSEFLRTMQERGYIHQITHPVELDEAAANGTITAYIGFDATAASLHVGHMIQIMMLRRLQQAGHKPIVLMGGGTTKVGDPTDKDGQRPLLTHEQIQANIATIKGTFQRFLTFGEGPADAIMLDNDAWLSKFGYVEFLRNYGVHFTVNRMLAFDSVKARLEREQPMTFLEFNYMLMQSVDFLELERQHGCLLQMGGSDQWGNIVNGVELIRRVDHKPAFGLTTPLLSTASGQKMGKTVGGAVWLNADMRSPTTTGSSGATPRTPTSAASCACSPTCRWPRSPVTKPCKAPRSTRPRRPWRTRRPACCTGRRRPTKPPRPRA